MRGRWWAWTGEGRGGGHGLVKGCGGCVACMVPKDLGKIWQGYGTRVPQSQS